MTTEERILAEVSAFGGVPRSVLKSNSRKSEVVALRALAIKCMLRRNITLSAICRFFGHTDHTSAMNARDTNYPTDNAIGFILERTKTPEF
jgi:chromosomal replication initiation ATPase DnaA